MIRRVCQILLRVILGLITTIAIAAYAAVCAPVVWPSSPGGRDSNLAWPGPVPDGWENPEFRIAIATPMLSARRYEGDSMTGVADGFDGSRGFYECNRFELYEAGWPARALGWSAIVRVKDTSGFTLSKGRFQTHSRTGSESGLAAPARAPGLRVQIDRRIPTMPLPGLAADTILFALAWSAALYAPSAIRRVVRRRRGRCAACGYDLAGLTGGGVCPECGKGAPVKRRE